MTRPRSEQLDGWALVRKIVLSVVTGFATFVGSAELDGTLQVSLSDQLILTTLVGGVTLLTQYLVELEGRFADLETGAVLRLDRLEARQLESIVEARAETNHQFERISNATRFFTLIEKSALQTDALTQLVDRSGQINGSSPQLVRDLAHYEIERLSGLMKSLSNGNEVFYDGEDREWLLGLATKVTSSILATSLATVDAGGKGFEGGLWMNDLGSRYLHVQREAILRGVQIRRIFVFDKPEFAHDIDFVRIRHLQLDAGIQVRMLDNSMVPEHLKPMIFDFVLFDKSISYETSLATQMEAAIKPAIITTRLILNSDRVKQRADRFEALWTAAHEVD
jgi:hypothetical protein